LCVGIRGAEEARENASCVDWIGEPEMGGGTDCLFAKGYDERRVRAHDLAHIMHSFA